MKKLNKFFAILVALAMMATLCVSMAFAETDTYGEALATSGLTKVFDVPDGVTRPAATFKYTFTPDASNPSGSSNAWTEQIQIAGGEGTETGFLRLSDVFTLDPDDATGKYKITKPGVYLFTVSENDEDHATAPSIVSYDSLDITDEDVDYDGHTYVLRLYIARNEDGDLEETAITVIDEDDNDPVDESKKIDPTEDEEITTPDDPTTPDVNEEEKEGLETSDWQFVNYYTKTVNDNTADGAFNIAKALAESAEDTAYPFTIAITVDEQTVKGYTEAAPYTLTAGGKTWSFYEGSLTASQNLTISPNAKLVFNTFPAGATVNIVENMQNSSIANKDLYTAKAEGTNITVNSTAYTAKEEDLNRTTGVYDAKSAVTVTNKLASSDVTPTGILINNLPYIVLALVAIGGLCAYVIVRRKADDEA